ncbi:class I SAM-dependent methyltransferase [Olivibacter sp. CPCC 100613]|uniref:class I SAM-dependent methyltransferase n=1 Tax=Olivibacter sp. CPCC 100613 TaxID=3079931 RepID=UPI002FFC2F41
MKENKEPTWYERENDWVLRKSIIFNKHLIKLTFLEVARILKLIGQIPNSGKILDLCCGIGRHALEFARKGYQVTAVDITKDYLDTAKLKAEKEGLDITFIRENMRDFCAPNSFDLIVNLCTSFGYMDTIEEDLQVLRNVHSSLKQNGIFLMELLGKEVIARNFKENEEFEEDGKKVVAESRIVDDWNKLICKRTIFDNDGPKQITVAHRLYSAKELTTYLFQIGFRDINVFGDFGGNPYDSYAKSMIITARK